MYTQTRLSADFAPRSLNPCLDLNPTLALALRTNAHERKGGLFFYTFLVTWRTLVFFFSAGGVDNSAKKSKRGKKEDAGGYMEAFEAAKGLLHLGDR